MYIDFQLTLWENDVRIPFLLVKELCIEKSTKTEPVEFEPLVEKGM